MQAFLGRRAMNGIRSKDMLLALIGAIIAQLTLAGLHDRQRARLPVLVR